MVMNASKPDETGPPDMSTALRDNIKAMRERRKKELASAGIQNQLADVVTSFTGSMMFVYLHLLLYGAWLAVNLIPGLPHFDPTFVVLAMVASVEAIFLSTFVLISQNRAKVAADKRDELDLHINLLAEHELTQLITMVAAITSNLKISTDADRELREMTQDVKPEAVLREIENRNDNR